MPFTDVDLASITPLTPQQVFDNALNGVVRQKGFSIRGEACYYNHPLQPNVHCGIGHSIPAKWAVPNSRIVCLVATDPRVNKLFRDIPHSLLSNVQSTHDFAARVSRGMGYFKEEMKKLAQEYNLTYTEPTT